MTQPYDKTSLSQVCKGNENGDAKEAVTKIIVILLSFL